MADIVLGKEFFETVRIKDASGRVLSEFSFNPSDANIAARYEDFVKAMAGLGDKIQEYEDANKDSSAFDKAKGILEELKKEIYCEFDKFLAANVSESIFSVMHPLSPTPYGYYMNFILKQVLEAINKSTDAKIKKMDAKVAKYTSKYRRK